MTNSKLYLNLAVKAALESGIVFKKYFGQAGKTKNKNHDPKNLVTQIDLKIERQIRAQILKAFPNSQIIGEEFGANNIDPNKPVWVIDPIDGTTNFIHGIPFCCISIAAWQNNQPIAAVIYNPILDQMFTATKNGGAFLNNKKIKVSNTNSLSKAFGSYGWGHDIAKIKTDIVNILPMLNKIRAFGTTAQELCMVATGQFDFKLQGTAEFWDIAAAVLIITEAGGKVTNWSGSPITPQTKQIIATNNKIHLAAVKILSKAK